MASRENGALYCGVTSDLARRVSEHRRGVFEGFTRRYGVKRPVWSEMHARRDEAIAREKQIRGGARRKKLALIAAMNPEWRDLYDELNC